MFEEHTAQLRELCIWNLLCNYETIVNPVYVQGVVRNCIYLFQKTMQQTKMATRVRPRKVATEHFSMRYT